MEKHEFVESAAARHDTEMLNDTESKSKDGSEPGFIRGRTAHLQIKHYMQKYDLSRSIPEELKGYVVRITGRNDEQEIPGSKAGNEMFNLSKEDDVRKYVARKREALHQDPQGPTSSYSHPSPAPSSHPLHQAQKIGASEGEV
ncbi:hypothetical protein ARMSODRAFT_977821 [Armillaria solidipes]|uniref:Uncharacterized protein n=1 Tax=Armillaria solidipes TaxID=1076256 RepID=A0A2H3B5J4_9AGAR|nr:hypothetical protein ARMSODRAFT_977821 [Armillaria solidipes]